MLHRLESTDTSNPFDELTDIPAQSQTSEGQGGSIDNIDAFSAMGFTEATPPAASPDKVSGMSDLFLMYYVVRYCLGCRNRPLYRCDVASY